MQITERYNFRYQNVNYVNKVQCFSHWDKKEETGLVIRNEYPQKGPDFLSQLSATSPLI